MKTHHHRESVLSSNKSCNHDPFLLKKLTINVQKDEIREINLA